MGERTGLLCGVKQSDTAPVIIHKRPSELAIILQPSDDCLCCCVSLGFLPSIPEGDIVDILASNEQIGKPDLGVCLDLPRAVAMFYLTNNEGRGCWVH